MSNSVEGHPRASRALGEGHYERFRDEGIAAARRGNHDEARFKLRRAAEWNPADPQIWVWLSATTDDPAEQRNYLEYALAADPTNAIARRGLEMLARRAAGGGQPAPPPRAAPAPLPPLRCLHCGQLIPYVAGVDHVTCLHCHSPWEIIDGVIQPLRVTSDAPIPAASSTFLCTACGGLMKYDPRTAGLRCEQCGAVQQIEARNVGSDDEEAVLTHALRTARAHRWAEAHHAITCQQCGASSLLPPARGTECCPFCGSDHLIQSQETAGLIEPQAIIPMRVEQAAAQQALGTWLREGWFSPGDLHRQARTIELRPAYYPFWTFDATYVANWTAKVGERSRSGQFPFFFDDLLVPGTSRIPFSLSRRAEPFRVKEAVEFRPEFVAGWPMLLYDQSLADASIEARSVIVEEARATVEDKILVAEDKSDVQITSGEFSGQTYRHIYLPLWVGRYRYKAREYQVLINGETGTVGGEKPRSPRRLWVTGLVVALFVVAVLAFLWWLLAPIVSEIDWAELFRSRSRR